jgi:hypothetical protein
MQEANVSFPETYYHIISTGYEIPVLFSGTGQPGGFAFQTKLASGEGSGFEDLYSSINSVDAEAGLNMMWCRARPTYKRFKDHYDPDRIDMTVARDFRFDTTSLTGIIGQANQIVTYNSITYNVGGTVSGSTGGTVTLELFRSDTKELLLSNTRTGDGSYNFVWYDNTVPVYVVAREAAANLGGTSNTQNASTSISFNISMGSGGGGGPTYFSY